MAITYTSVSRPDPIYFAWKKAANSLFNDSQNFMSVAERIKEEYGVTVKKYYKEYTRYLTHIDITFESEEHKVWFMLKWG